MKRLIMRKFINCCSTERESYINYIIKNEQRNDMTSVKMAIDYALDPVYVIAQNREQQLIDIPTSITVK